MTDRISVDKIVEEIMALCEKKDDAEARIKILVSENDTLKTAAASQKETIDDLDELISQQDDLINELEAEISRYSDEFQLLQFSSPVEQSAAKQMVDPEEYTALEIKYLDLLLASKALYTYGYWVLVYPFPGGKIDSEAIAKGDQLWKNLRDAAGIEPGTATARWPAAPIPPEDNDDEDDPGPMVA